ncbi:hypothetical protein KMB28_09225 [Streptomyces sp. CBG30]|nr:hypothetical protein [Streptomyces sp. CBG30]
MQLSMSTVASSYVWRAPAKSGFFQRQSLPASQVPSRVSGAGCVLLATERSWASACGTSAVSAVTARPAARAVVREVREVRDARAVRLVRAVRPVLDVRSVRIVRMVDQPPWSCARRRSSAAALS